jgi:hypothetical protein
VNVSVNIKRMSCVCEFAGKEKGGARCGYLGIHSRGSGSLEAMCKL